MSAQRGQHLLPPPGRLLQLLIPSSGKRQALPRYHAAFLGQPRVAPIQGSLFFSVIPELPTFEDLEGQPGNHQEGARDSSLPDDASCRSLTKSLKERVLPAFG
jgi:hypothetical protein